MNLGALIIGGVVVCIGALFLYYGAKTPKGKSVPWDIGRYLDRYGFMYMGILILFVGAMALAVGFLF